VRRRQQRRRQLQGPLWLAAFFAEAAVVPTVCVVAVRWALVAYDTKQTERR